MRYVRSLMLASAVVFVTPALAADLSRPANVYKAPAPVPPAFSWTGVYLGVQGGYGWSTSQGLDIKGGLVGGQLGYNYQMGNFVVGLEGDGDWANINQTVTGTAFNVPVSATFNIETLASLRARFGVAYNNVLFYGTAGGGWGQGKLSGTALGVTVSSEAWQSGWTAGAGVEWAFDRNWTARVEYLHYGLGSANYFNVSSGNLDVDTVKVGLSYLFH